MTLPPTASSGGAVGQLAEIAVFYDREEAVVAMASLDSAGLFVVLNGLTLIDNYPELRGAVGYRLFGLAEEIGDARALLSWRPENWSPRYAATRFFSAPILNTALMTVTMMGLPYMARGLRGASLGYEE